MFQDNSKMNAHHSSYSPYQSPLYPQDLDFDQLMSFVPAVGVTGGVTDDEVGVAEQEEDDIICAESQPVDLSALDTIALDFPLSAEEYAANKSYGIPQQNTPQQQQQTLSPQCSTSKNNYRNSPVGCGNKSNKMLMNTNAGFQSQFRMHQNPQPNLQQQQCGMRSYNSCSYQLPEPQPNHMQPPPQQPVVMASCCLIKSEIGNNNNYNNNMVHPNNPNPDNINKLIRELNPIYPSTSANNNNWFRNSCQQQQQQQQCNLYYNYKDDDKKVVLTRLESRQQPNFTSSSSSSSSTNSNEDNKFMMRTGNNTASSQVNSNLDQMSAKREHQRSDIKVRIL